MADSTTQTKYGGASQRDYLRATPANVILFAGYGFAKEYRQARGHVHAIEDVTATQAGERQDAGHLLDVQEPRRAAADGHDGAGEVLRRASSTT